MLQDTITLLSGSDIVNMTVASGTSDPGTAIAGALFYRTDLSQLRVYSGSVWSSVGSSGTLTAVNGTSGQISASTTAGVVTLSLPTAFVLPVDGLSATSTVTFPTGSTSGNTFKITGSPSGTGDFQGGVIIVTGGPAAAATATGGYVQLIGGTNSSTGPGGNIQLSGGPAVNAGGSVILTTGVGSSSGVITFQTGTSPSTKMTINGTGALGFGSSPSFGTSGQVLTSAGTGAVPTWATPSTGVSSFNTRTGAVTLTSLDVTTALTYTPVNKAGDTMSATLTFSAGTVTGIPTPVNASDVPNKAYVDAVAQGLSWKQATIASTTVNLTGAYVGTPTFTLTNNSTQVALVLDGITVTTGQRVLVKNQTTQSQNGIYSVTNAGSGATNWVLTRTSDFNEITPIDEVNGAAVYINQGTLNNNTTWTQIDNVTLFDTSPIAFAQIAAGAGGVSSITGTANQITASASTGAITLSLPSTLNLGTTINVGTATGPATIQQVASTTNPGAVLSVIGSATTGVNQGGEVFINGGSASGSGAGGVVVIQGGASTSGTGGGVQIVGFPGTASGQAGGPILVQSGHGAGAGAGGALTLAAGVTPSGTGGNLIFQTGSTTTTNRLQIDQAGQWFMGAGAGTAGTTGQVLTTVTTGSPPIWANAAAGSLTTSQIAYGIAGVMGGTTDFTFTESATVPTVTIGTTNTVTANIVAGANNNTTAATNLNIASATGNTGSGGQLNAPGGALTLVSGNGGGTANGGAGNAGQPGGAVNITSGNGGGGAATNAPSGINAGGGGGILTIAGGTGGGGGNSAQAGATGGAGGAGASIVIQPGTGGTGATENNGGTTGAGGAGGTLTFSGGIGGPAGGGTAGAGPAGAGGNIVFKVAATTTLGTVYTITNTGAHSYGTTATNFGTSGQVLTSQGNAAPTWAAPTGATVSNVGGAGAVQYTNGSGTLVSDAGHIWTSGTNTLTLGTIASGPNLNGPAGGGNTFTINAGTATGATASGGGLTLATGAGGATNQPSGAFLVQVGASGAGVNSNAGSITLQGGNSPASTSSGSGSSIFLTAGSGTSAAGGGSVTLQSGISATGTAGSLVFKTGTTTAVTRLTIGPAGDWNLPASGTPLGTSGQVLTSQGAGAPPQWTSSSAALTTGQVGYGVAGALGSSVNLTFNGVSTLLVGQTNSAAVVTAAAASALTISAGISSTGGNPGGALNLTAGNNTGGGVGGSVIITAGSATTAANAGGVTISGGAITSTGVNAGAISIAAGSGLPNSTGGVGGAVTIASGAAGGGGLSGAITLTSGAGNTGAPGGAISLTAGTGFTTSNSAGGAINLTAGSAPSSTAAAGGSVNITTGTSTTGTAGSFKVTTGTTAAVLRFVIDPAGQWLIGAAGATAATSGQVLTTVTAGGPPTWTTIAAGATVSNVGGAGAVQYTNGAGTLVSDAGHIWTSGTQVLTLGTAATGPTITATTGSTAGTTFTINGSAAGTTSGGALNINGGTATTGGVGGAVTIAGGGVGAASNFTGGTTTLVGGTGGTGSAGNAIVAGGNAVGSGALGGNVSILGGNATVGVGTAGNVTISTGTAAIGGNIVFKTGATPAVVFTINSNGALATGTSASAFGTSGQVLTSNGNTSPTWQTPSAGAAAAGTLTGTTLAANVVTSSLTSVGTLTNTTITATTGTALAINTNSVGLIITGSATSTKMVMNSTTGTSTGSYAGTYYQFAGTQTGFIGVDGNFNMGDSASGDPVILAQSGRTIRFSINGGAGGTTAMAVTTTGGVTIAAPSSGLGLSVAGGGATITGTVTGTTFAGAGTSLTGTAAGLSIGGNAATATNSSVTNTATNASFFPTFVSGSTTSNYGLGQSANLFYNPSTNVLNAGTFNVTSDRNLKKNIVKIDNALDLVSKLNGVRFDWKSNDLPSAGLIAQDVEEVMPELVATREDGTKSMNYNGIIGALVEAIKSQQDMIVTLNARLAKLEG